MTEEANKTSQTMTMEADEHTQLVEEDADTLVQKADNEAPEQIRAVNEETDQLVPTADNLPAEPIQRPNQEPPRVVIMEQRKSLLLGIVLTCLFGGLGLLYSSMVGGIIIVSIEALCVLFSFLTFGYGAIITVPVLIVLHVISLICTILAINSHNKRVTAMVR